jgi:hypothetical protein
MSPQVRKDFLERIRSGKTLKDKARIFANGIHDMFYETNYEDEFGNIHKLTNPDGTPVESLPVYYRNKLDDMSFLSLDVTSSMIMYADMAHNYGEMSNIIDALEVGVDVMSERRIKQTQNGKPMVNRVEHLGRTIVDSVIKRKGDSRFIERLNSYMSMQVYGHNSLNEGTIFGLSTTKTLGVIGGYTALSTYALNLFSGVSNVITGRINARIDAVSKEFFDIGDLASADM